MSAAKSIYKVLRSILFTSLLVVVGIVLLIYITLSVPAVSEQIKAKAEKELSSLLGGKVKIERLDVMPFNEVRLHGVSLYSPDGKRCISVGRLGAGVRLLSLITEGTVEISYAEIISLNARIAQPSKDSPLNIDFIIKALSKKDDNKPSTKSRLVLRNVVIRKSNISFDREYIPSLQDKSKIDFNHLELSNFRADVALPLLTNDDFKVDLRRLAFEEKSGFSVSDLSLKAHITPHELELSDFQLILKESKIAISDQLLKINGYSDIINALRKESHSLWLTADPMIPGEVSAFYPRLSGIEGRYRISLRASGNATDIKVQDFILNENNNNIDLKFAADVRNADHPELISVVLERLSLDSSPNFNSMIANVFLAGKENAREIVSAIGSLSLNVKGEVDLNSRNSNAIFEVISDAGDIMGKGMVVWNGGNIKLSDLAVKTESLDVGRISGVSDFGILTTDISADVSIHGKDFNGTLTADIPRLDYRGLPISNIYVDGSKNGSDAEVHFSVDDEFARVNAEANCLIAGASSIWNVMIDADYIQPGMFGVSKITLSDSFSGNVRANITGNSPDTFAGTATLENFSYKSKESFHLDNLSLTADIDGNNREYSLLSDFLRGTISGSFSPEKSVDFVKYLISHLSPSDIPATRMHHNRDDFADIDAEYDFTLMPDDALFATLKMPMRPGVPVSIKGYLRGAEETATFSLDVPYMVQGRDKLIKNTSLNLVLRDSLPASLNFHTVMPVKKDYMTLDLNGLVANGHADTHIGFASQSYKDNRGSLNLGLDFARNALDNKWELLAKFEESSFSINDAMWTVSPGTVEYRDKYVSVNNLRIYHGPQHIDISGRGTESPLDAISVDLAGIDLEYLFDILNINHVDFGGIATGTARVSSLFSKAPRAETDGLFVNNLAYNGCVLGDGNLESHWDNDEKMVAINADIDDGADASATVRGGVYVTRDSLSFDFNAHKIDIGLLAPFMSGFTSSVKGRASGNVKLYGTFKDIDLGGKAFADTITMKVDYTNVCYSGSDSVFFSPGKISIPSMRLYDKYGNSGLLRGTVTHHYLSDANFDFEITDVDKMLVYDTDPKMNPRWYGRVFASGMASVHGIPGLVGININMATAAVSEFALVLDETETAIDYTFLTFSDRRKASEKNMVIRETFEEKLRKKNEEEILRHRADVFSLDIALDVNTGAKMIIVMDPDAGDKITANGNGALQMHYDSDTDELNMYGKYSLEHGDYNFSLQDLILKNFKIKQGSSISFNGDPLHGLLDITAAYRVNSNLTDLDLSFKNDPDLTRTNVPVDAMLKVTGDIHAPEIKFDIELPTVTSDVERKVKSIISTEEMMNRQVIYLLALSRFYSPEYMGAEQGGELASVASSTLSSQIQNIVSSLTDKVSLAPSFKSEKSDLSDMEVDVALSSSLFDNRLLINGNLGYRDRSTSQTTFIGDFDLEYLLSRDGRLRLKAYNHFNDASYYLKSALTTQGIGIVYRKDFDDPFTFLKRMFRKKKKGVVNVDNKNGDKRKDSLNNGQSKL